MGGKIGESFVSPVKLWRRHLPRLFTYGRSTLLFALGALAAFVAVLLYNVFVPTPPQLTTREVNDSIVQALASATPPPAYSARVYRVIRPSLVFIETEAPDDSGEAGHGIGSGVVINSGGDILTSLHVVAKASDIQVFFADSTQSSARVIVQRPELDIAVLRADQFPADLVPAILGNPNAMRVGDEAFVVGNPLGLYSSMSAGVISGFDRSFRPQNSDQKLNGLIQIDAAVNPGNSGGPLLNRHGQVIGIVTALANPTEQDVFIGIGFAVPINIAGGAAGLPPY
jgi:S1-C subfamily serine protease